jgi:transcription termination factor NusB
MNKEHRDKLRKAVIAALFDASLTEDRKLAAFHTHEIYSALTGVIAAIAAQTDSASSPTKRRKFAEEIAKSLQRQLSENREYIEENGFPFQVVRPEEFN